ncbi:MAG: signal recognition particle-docking protein FtsY [Candidatus Eisenbacteria bacterium]|uniref:Signal recognition particle receptor FtsY n=1 Tax=Eiseniibacteriota bacterium TaxID=2212470 RepID=A0A938BS15_UNCEI|nr:signal recognition particle-docking protein FtsY [Candidatus Eisenbacteria bacterium]
MGSFWKKIADGMKKTRAVFTANLQQVFQRGGALDEAFYEELEEVLLTADVGVETTQALLERMKALARERGVSEAAEARELMRAAAAEVLARASAAGPRAAAASTNAAAGAGAAAAATNAAAAAEPRVILVVGVNGVGKTTSIGKLAWRQTRQGLKTLVVAADTYRAAALEQLAVWAERAGADLIRSQSGADAAAVAYDGVRAAMSRGAQVVIVDTAGRLQTNRNLMAELTKIHRVLGKALPGAPHEVLLVLDATVGQNALSQVASFREAAAVDGILLAKLDGSARGGVILAIADRLGTPVRYVGLGEGIEDLADFDADDFARALLEPLGAGGE